MKTAIYVNERHFKLKRLLREYASKYEMSNRDALDYILEYFFMPKHLKRVNNQNKINTLENQLKYLRRELDRIKREL